MRLRLVVIALVAACGDNADPATAPPCVVMPADASVVPSSSPSPDAALAIPSASSSDSGSGLDWKVTQAFGASRDRAQAMVRQPDGKLLVAGGVVTTNASGVVARYSASGVLDLSFGNGGRARLPSLPDGTAIALQSDGKIVVAGGDGFGVARLLPDGTPDPVFAGLGSTAVAFVDDGFVESVAVQPDGKIVAAGWANVGGMQRFAIVRWSSNGSRDLTFDDDGIALVRVSDFGVDGALAIALETEGTTTKHIVVAGYSYNAAGTTDYAVVRLNALDGSPDASFGSGDGIVSVEGDGSAYAVAVTPDGEIILGGNHAVLRLDASGVLDPTFGDASPFELRALALRPDGKIVAVGSSSSSFAVARFLSDGTLDPTFDAHAIGFGTGAFGMALEPDGQIDLCGYATIGTDEDFALARLTEDGSLDLSVTTPMGTGSSWIQAIALAADGSLYTTGLTYNGTSYDTFVARFDVAGKLDPSFGGTGIVTTSFTIFDDYALGIALQADGKVVIGGAVLNGYLLARYLPDGALDPSFGSGGKIRENGAYAQAVAIRATGEILLAGEGSHDLTLSSFRSDGTPDLGFGVSGLAFTDFGGASTTPASAMVIDAHGNAVVVGSRYDYGDPANSHDIALTRFGPSGELDASFGTAGHVRTSIAPSDLVNAVALQPDGKIVVAGTSVLLAPSHADFAVVRYLEDGTLDPSFGGHGFVTSDFGGIDQARALLVEPDGHLVVAGETSAGGQMILARYDAAGALDPSFVRVPFAGPARPFAIARRPDGRIVVAGFATAPEGHAQMAIAQYRP